MTRRVALLLVLLGLYAAFLERRLSPAGAVGLDPVSPRAREVEHAIAAERHADALPLALELEASYPREPLVAYWLALIYQGLGRGADEVAAWERFITLGAAPEEACPGLADARARHAGVDAEQGLRAYERCAELDPRDPERLIDLGDALDRARRRSDALDAYRRAAGLDPTHPVVRRRIDRVSRELAGAP
jgi:tetratricopeptide (TPR) repeat protein